MPAKPKAGVKQVNAELPEELLDRVKAFAEGRGQTVRYVIERALIRHLESPPPILPDPALPPGEPDPPVPKEPPKKRGRPKKA